MFAVDVDKLIEEAKGVIKEERSKFDPILKTIETYAKEHKLQLSDIEWQVRADGNLGMWSGNALRDATAIANLLYSRHNKFIFMKTVISYQEFEISVMGRKILTVYRYPQIKGVDTKKLFPTGIQVSGVNFLDPEIDIMEQYHKLYMPFPDNWPLATEIEARMFAKIKTRFGITDGGRKEHHKSPELQKLRRHIFDALKMEDLGILVGHWAANHLQDRKESPPDKIQVVAPAGIDAAAYLEKLENVLRDATHMKLSHKTEDVHVPGDYWLQRTTYYIQSDSTTKFPLMDTFNSQNYELVPFHLYKGVKVGNAFVLCRFLMVDKWILNVLEAMGILGEGVATKKSRVIIQTVDTVRALDKYKFGDQYDGIWRDPVIEKRKMRSKEFMDYVPLHYEKHHGKLRTV